MQFQTKLLLIEPHDDHAVKFLAAIQKFPEGQVVAVWRRSVSEALAVLESGEEFDQVWLDPASYELAHDPGVLNQALVALKQFVPSREIYLLGEQNGLAQLKKKFSLAKSPVARDDRDRAMEIVSELLRRKTGGGSDVQVKIARIEAVQQGLRGQLGDLDDKVDDVEESAKAQDQQVFQLAYQVADHAKRLNQLDRLASDFKEFQSDSDGNVELASKRWEVLGALALALVSGIAAPLTLYLAGVDFPGGDSEPVEINSMSKAD